MKRGSGVALAAAGLALLAALAALLFFVPGRVELARAPAAAPEAPPNASAGALVRPDAEEKAPEPSTPLAAPPQPLETAHVATPAPDEPSALPDVGLIVFGRVTTKDGTPLVAGSAGISFTDAVGVRTVVDLAEDGRYSVAGLPPGTWRYSASDLHHHQELGRIELAAGDPPRRLDLVLRAKTVLVVRIDNRSGDPLPLRTPWDLHPLATLEPPGPTFAWGTYSNNEQRGVGSFWQRGYYCDASGDGALGCLVLEEDPPVYVSLLLADQVLATQRVEAGAREVRFELSPDEVRASLGSIAFRLVDAGTGEPLSGGRVDLDLARGMRSSVAGDGRYSFADLPPGTYRLSPWVPGHETTEREVQLAPGAALDLGDWPLAPARRIELSVRDPAGNPVRITFVTGRLEGERERFTPELTRRYATGAAGEAKLDGLSAARYVVLPDVYSHDLASDPNALPALTCAPIEVDLTKTPVAELSVVAVPAAALSLQPAADLPDEGYRVDVLAEDGLRILGTRVTPRWGPRVALPAGRYELRVTAPDGKEESRSIALSPEGTAIAIGPP